MGRAALLILAFLLSPALALGQSTRCDPLPAVGPIDTTPASGACGVTLDAPIKVRYPAGFFDDLTRDPRFAVSVCQRSPGAATPPMCAPGSPPEACDAASADRIFGEIELVGEESLFFFPDGGLVPNALYDVTALGDPPFTFRFTTGNIFDERAPFFGEIERVSTDKATVTECGPPEGSYRVDVQFPVANDDGPSTSIEYRLFLTRGAQLDAPELRATRRNFPTELVTMAFVLEPEEASEPVCVVVHAVDGVGKVDDDGTPVCFEPIEGNFFQPLCATMAPGSRPPFGTVWFAVGVLGVLGVQRRLRR